MTFYHGTSSNLNIKDKLLPPDETMVLREDFRKKDTDIVFLTLSKSFAWSYAVKACAMFGGSPKVYIVEPDKDSLSAKSEDEFTCHFADIIGEWTL